MVEAECEHVSMPLIGDDAPSFTSHNDSGTNQFSG